MKNTLLFIFLIFVTSNIALSHEDKHRFVQETQLSQGDGTFRSYFYVSILDAETGKVKICAATTNSKGEVRRKEKDKCTNFQ